MSYINYDPLTYLRETWYKKDDNGQFISEKKEEEKEEERRRVFRS